MTQHLDLFALTRALLILGNAQMGPTAQLEHRPPGRRPPPPWRQGLSGSADLPRGHGLDAAGCRTEADGHGDGHGLDAGLSSNGLRGLLASDFVGI